MRIIPVLDLLGGQAVHAIKGERENYRPVRSALCASSDPLEIARAFRNKLGLNEIYVADLDAIRGSDETCHAGIISVLALGEELKILLDAGIADVDTAQAWLDAGIHQVIVGSETLENRNVLEEFPARFDRKRLIFSVDSRGGKTLSRCPDLSAMSPIHILQNLQATGWQEVILLNLSRVGTGEGADRALLAEAHVQYPNLSLLVGGGIAGPDELIELQSIGVAGVLMATALHQGDITMQHLSAVL